MKRTEPVASPNTPSVRQDLSNSPQAGQNEQKSSPAAQASPEQQKVGSNKPESVPLGLTATEPDRPKANATPLATSATPGKTQVTRSKVPAILLEGDDP